MANTVIPNSTYLDFTSYGTTTATTAAAAYGLPLPPTPATETINVAFTLPRANDPTALLDSNWATRQTTLAQLEANGTLWSTYGASASDYATVKAGLAAISGVTLLGDAAGSDGYVSSVESRTIWASLTPDAFQTVFGTTPYQGGGLYYWDGNLSLPSTWNVSGLWFDTAPIWGTYPAVSDLSGGAVANLQQGSQSIGNGLSATDTAAVNYAGDIANWFYHFPLAGMNVPTATIGLLEPGIGTAIPADATWTFQQGFERYRANAGFSGPGDYYLIANNGQSYEIGNHLERSLDLGVLLSANPGSTIGLYAGSGFHLGPGYTEAAHSNAFTAFQAAFWDEVNNPPVISSSFSIFQQASPDSPFAAAVKELFIDAALRNISVLMANNDWGSSWNFGDGLANQNVSVSSPYIVLVGGTSITTLAEAPQDPTVASLPSGPESLYTLAMAGDPSVLWTLIEGGLMQSPGDAGPDAAQVALLESVWNAYVLSGSSFGPSLASSDGGVDTSQPTPWYQTAFGLTPASVNPGGGTGRGAPDVAALAGGDMAYYGPPGDMKPIPTPSDGYIGTSDAAPMWAALVSQIDTIFHDQGLPQLGYMNDLLYIAAAIAPASFNDITYGNNISSFLYGGPIDWAGTQITLTGYGYHAGPGYDLTTGLGSPNGVLLARTLTEIAHSQMWFGAAPGVIAPDGHDGWQSGADQTLLFQTMSDAVTQVGVATGPDAFGFFSAASGSFAWTSRLAEQSLQADFDPHLVILFDKYAQGAVGQDLLSAGESLSLAVNGSSGQALQAALTSSFGFVDFMTSEGAVRVARPVAIAETAGGQDDQIAIVRLRQDGVDNLSLTFYRVDDLNGTINGLHPGDPGYQAALQSRAYQMTTGGTSINGPGYGNFEQAGLMHVNAGDLVAMQLTNDTTGSAFSAFAQANEVVNGQHVGHLWNYGANTWGWEDMPGGGDHDYNDLIVGLDFTSAAGHGWLA